VNIKQDLVRHYHWLRQYGLNDSHSGNASVRDGDTVWITPTGCCADTLCEDDLVACTIEGEVGDQASLDAPLHIAVYQQNPQSRAVLHSHGPHAVALTLNGKNFTPRDFEGQFYFAEVPVLTIQYQDYLKDSPAQVARALKEHKVAIVCGHGIYAHAETINQAYKWNCSLELSAQTAFIAQQSEQASKA
jgi:L-fuculose-phosphate aldolase